MRRRPESGRGYMGSDGGACGGAFAEPAADGDGGGERCEEETAVGFRGAADGGDDEGVVHGDGTVEGEGAAVDGGAGVEGDGGEGHDGAFESGVGAEGGGAADLPEDAAGIGSVDEADAAVGSGDEGGACLEDPEGVGVAGGVEREGAGEFEGAAAVVDAWEERHAGEIGDGAERDERGAGGGVGVSAG